MLACIPFHISIVFTVSARRVGSLYNIVSLSSLLSLSFHPHTHNRWSISTAHTRPPSLVNLITTSSPICRSHHNVPLARTAGRVSLLPLCTKPVLHMGQHQPKSNAMARQVIPLFTDNIQAWTWRNISTVLAICRSIPSYPSSCVSTAVSCLR